MASPSNQGAALKGMIEAHGYTVTDAAFIGGVKRTTLNNWLNGPNQLDLRNREHREAVERICTALGEPIDQLLAVENEARKPHDDTDVLEPLLYVLEAPDAPKQVKDAARESIRALVRRG